MHVALPPKRSSALRIARVLGLGPAVGPRYLTGHGEDVVDIEFDDEAGKWLVTAWCDTVVEAESSALRIADLLREAGVAATAFDLDPGRPLDHIADRPTWALHCGS